MNKIEIKDTWGKIEKIDKEIEDLEGQRVIKFIEKHKLLDKVRNYVIENKLYRNINELNGYLELNNIHKLADITLIIEGKPYVNLCIHLEDFRDTRYYINVDENNILNINTPMERIVLKELPNTYAMITSIGDFEEFRVVGFMEVGTLPRSKSPDDLWLTGIIKDYLKQKG